MTRNLLLLVICILLSYCSNAPEEQSTNKDTTELIVGPKEPEIQITTKGKYDDGFYIINVSAIADSNEAIKQVRNLKTDEYPAGYLWIKDFESLSGKELYAVFIGPFDDIYPCFEYLDRYQKKDPKAYAVKVNHEKERIVIYNEEDMRVNGQKVCYIFTYLNPEYSDDFYDKIGDWGYIINARGFYEMTEGNWAFISDFDIENYSSKELQKLGLSNLKSEQYGVILMKGNSTKFIDLTYNTMSIFDLANEFFGYNEEEKDKQMPEENGDSLYSE